MKFHSMLEMVSESKLLPVPIVRQSTEYDCGPAAVQAILSYYGKDVQESELIDKLHTDPKEGTSIPFIEDYLNTFEDLSVIGKSMSIKELRKFIDQGIPVILSLQAWSDKKNVDYKKDLADAHYAIAVGYEKDKIIFSDPSSIIHVYLMNEELLDRWHEKDGNIFYKNYGIAVKGPKIDPDEKIGKME